MLRDLMPPGKVEEGDRPHRRKPACEEADPMKRIADDRAVVHEWAQRQTKETLAEWFAEFWSIAAVHGVAFCNEPQAIKQAPFPRAMERMDAMPGVISRWADDDDGGLGRLEESLGIIPAADNDRSSRIDVVVAEVAKTVPLWEQMGPVDLKEDKPLMDRLFSMAEKTQMFAAVHGGRLPNTWWAETSCRLRDAGIFDRLMTQVHRNTHHMTAERHLADQSAHIGSKGGRNPEATKAKSKVLPYFLAWLNEPGKYKSKTHFSKVMMERFPVLAADGRAVRNWYEKWCIEHGVPVNAPPKTKPRKPKPAKM